MWRNLFKPEHQNWRWLFCFSLAIYIHLFINICEPYKGDKITYIWLSTELYLWHSLLNFVNVLFFSAVVNILLPKYFPSYFLPQNFTFERFILIVVCTSIGLGIGYFIGNYYFFNYEITISWFIIYIFKVVATNVLFAGVPFIITFLSIFNYYIDSRKFHHDYFDKESTQNLESPLNLIGEIPPQYPHEFEAQMPVMLRFSDNSNKKRLNIALSNLYYITSAHNYIEIVHQSDNTVKTTLLRNSLKTIEEEMIINAVSPLIRCHKAYIVNREKILELRGPAKSALFILSNIDTSIPISRQKYPELESQFRTLDD